MLVSRSEVDFERDLEIVREPAKFMALIEKYFLGSEMMLNGFEPPPQVKIIEKREPNHLVIDFQDFKVSVGEVYTIYTMLANYAHICGKVVQDRVKGGRYTLVLIEYLAIATKSRADLRIPITDNSVFISNFRVSRNDINFRTQRIPTSVKLAFSELENNLSGKADYLNVQPYETHGFDKNNLYEQVCKNAKPLLISNSLDPKSYSPFNRSYFDAKTFLKRDIEKYIGDARKKRIVSELCIPVIYLTHAQTPIPLGYVHMQSKTRHFLAEDVQEVWRTIKDVVERIRASNTLLISQRESIIDISRGGLMAYIKNPELIEHLYKQKAFTFDLFFHMQAPATLYGAIRSIVKVQDGIKLGVQILGNSSRANEMERFNENIRALEKRFSVVIKSTEEKK